MNQSEIWTFTVKNTGLRKNFISFVTKLFFLNIHNTALSTSLIYLQFTENWKSFIQFRIEPWQQFGLRTVTELGHSLQHKISMKLLQPIILGNISEKIVTY